MLKRVITVVIGLPIVVFFVYFGGWLLAALCGLTALFGLSEIYKAVSGGNKGIHYIGYIFTVLYFVTLQFFDFSPLLVLTAFVIILQSFLVINFKKLDIKTLTTTAYGFLYVTVLISFILLVRNTDYGQYFVWLIFASAFGCDTSAYLVGVSMGKRKLVNTPSPNKSLEGVIGGVCGAALVAGIYAFIITQVSAPPSGFIIASVIIAPICATFCIMGDMSASAIKRFTGIKDFGSIFPGHGGMMDRIDSIMMAAPVVYFGVQVFLQFS